MVVIVPWMLLLGNTLVVVVFLAKGFVVRDLGRIERQDLLPMIGMAILISALVFGAIHMTTSQFIFGGLYGLLLGWLFWRTGSIWPGVVIHVANNSTAMLLPDAWWDAVDNLALAWQVPVTIVCLGLLFIGLRWYNTKYPAISYEKNE